MGQFLNRRICIVESGSKISEQGFGLRGNPIRITKFDRNVGRIGECK